MRYLDEGIAMRPVALFRLSDVLCIKAENEFNFLEVQDTLTDNFPVVVSRADEYTVLVCRGYGASSNPSAS